MSVVWLSPLSTDVRYWSTSSCVAINELSFCSIRSEI
nr:MAG TPA: hypothetical protein [Caudoviricetes sp.]DAZ47370.1 MAG TPA: hypothetical protein [Caudoviricetes sp.]